MVTILISYAPGTQQMLAVCLESLARHDAGIPSTTLVVTDDQKGAWEASLVTPKYGIHILPVNMPDITSGSWRHSYLLDKACEEIGTEYILTLDSDCFPVASGWLSGLMEMQDAGAMVSGILWSWIPPPTDLNKDTIEYKIRRCHNWNNTQVACQLVKTAMISAFRKENVQFGGGTDTGFRILDKVREIGGTIKGYMPTCCALPSKDLDPEFNRHSCVIYADKVYHHGGATRQVQGAFVEAGNVYEHARERVFIEKGAEWILQEGKHHRYVFDREEEVAQAKMSAMYAMMREYLKTHDSLF